MVMRHRDAKESSFSSFMLRAAYLTPQECQLQINISVKMTWLDFCNWVMVVIRRGKGIDDVFMLTGIILHPSIKLYTNLLVTKPFFA